MIFVQKNSSINREVHLLYIIVNESNDIKQENDPLSKTENKIEFSTNLKDNPEEFSNEFSTSNIHLNILVFVDICMNLAPKHKELIDYSIMYTSVCLK